MSGSYVLSMPSAPTYSRLRRPWRSLAWLIGGLSWLLAAGAVLGLLIAGTVPEELANWVMDVVTAVVYGIVVVMMLPRTRHPVVWLLALTALGCGAAGFATGYAALAWPGHGLAFYLPYWAWVPGVYATIAVIPLLVLPGARRRWPVVTVAAVAILLGTLQGLTAVVAGLPHNPLGVDLEWWQTARVRLGYWPDRVIALLGVAEGVWLLLRTRRAPKAQQRGLRWLLAGHTAMVVALAAFLVPVPEGWSAPAAEISGTLLLLAQLFLPAALLVLVLGQQWWGVDARVNRGVVWAVMTVTVALAYLMLIAFAAAVVPDRSEVTLAFAVGLVGLGATPLRRLVQRRVDRLVYGAGADPGRLLRSAEAGGDYDIEGLAEALCRSLRLAEVQIHPSGPEERSEVQGDDVVVTLTSRGHEVGLLVARPRPGEQLDQRTTRMLTEVAGLVGMTIDLQQSVAALTRARSRVASVRHEERRMLRRDLHDGLGPALAGIRLGLIGARGLRERDPRASEEMLDALERELLHQGEEVRRLSRSLLPLALDDGDLESALTALAGRFRSAELEVTVSAAPQVDLAPATQVAIYQMASEALLNVTRHAQARHCEIVVRRRADGGATFTVTDDGVGFAAETSEGIGLRSMRERAEELGGSLRRGPGDSGNGSRLELRLPPPGAPS